ncbi:MAG: SBBP repeat-containing protein, partial [Candidatus Peribacter sp.]|nr:SBBP repeat-containing protein [Candidatus Peribacter sp.]
SVFNTSGTFQWAKRLGLTDNDYGYSVATDSSGNVIVAGYVTGNADLNGDGDSTDGGAEDATGYGNTDIVISVFNSSGTWQWAKRMGGIYEDQGFDVAVWGSTIAVTGLVSSGDGERFPVVNIDVNGDGDTTDGGVEDTTTYDGRNLLSVFNSAGTFQWAKRLSGNGNSNGITFDPSGNIVLSNTMFGNADVNGDGDSTDGGAEDGTGYAEADVLLSVFNTSGTFQWAKRLGGTDNDYGFSVATDTSGNVIVTGGLTGDADMNGDGDATDGGAEDATGYGSIDAFLSVFVQDYDPPVPSSFTPASSSTITSATPTVTLSLDEAGDCRASTSDESYADMSNDTDCTGDGTQNISCSIPLGSPGAKTVYIACQDSSGNTDSAGTNVSLSFTLDGGGGAAATRSLQQFWEAYDLEHGGKGTSIPSPTPSVPGPVSSPAAPSPPPVYVPPPRPPRLTPLDRRALRLQRLLQQQRSPPSTLAPAAQGGIPSSLLPRMLSTARIQLMLDRAEQRRFKRLRSH